MNKFLEDINTKNIFDDLRLQELAKQARSVLDNTDSVSIKYNENLRNHLHDQMAQLKNAIDESIEDIPFRRIRMPDQDSAMDYPVAMSI